MTPPACYAATFPQGTPATVIARRWLALSHEYKQGWRNRQARIEGRAA